MEGKNQDSGQLCRQAGDYPRMQRPCWNLRQSPGPNPGGSLRKEYGLLGGPVTWLLPSSCHSCRVCKSKLQLPPAPASKLSAQNRGWGGSGRGAGTGGWGHWPAEWPGPYIAFPAVLPQGLPVDVATEGNPSPSACRDPSHMVLTTLTTPLLGTWAFLPESQDQRPKLEKGP